MEFNFPITQKEFGALVGVSQAAVSDMVGRNVITPGASAGQWLLEYCKHLREIAAGRASNGEHDLATERARLAHHNANLASMEERKRAGELCECASVVMTMTRIGLEVRTALERMADKLADRVAAETDPHACHQLVSSEVEMTLEQLAKDCESAAHEIKGRR